MSRALLGALVCAAVWVGSAALRPAELGREAVLAEEPLPVVADAGPLATLADQIHDRLAERVPAIGAELRQRLAFTIVREAEAARLDPLLVLAVIEVESRFDADALSEAGAMGLMQLREPTLLKELRRQGIPGDPRDPVKNVQAGVHYLRRLLDAFGREEVALMAYNAGPNRILGYIREGGIPERFQVYPRRVRAELHRLRRDLAPLAASVAEAREEPPSLVVADRSRG
jgi:soluble lytic murein transglycosylase-like protein